MVRRLCILCFLLALWPGLALAQSAALMEAREALELGQREFGPNHPTTAKLLSDLAFLYQAQGRYTEAEPLYKRSLAIREKALGPEHPDVGGNLNNLVSLYQAQGRYAEAEPLSRRALAILEKAVYGHDMRPTAD